ncbi:MAG: CHRD domain-containing protein [Acidimicrobiia bacterium]
MRTTRFLLLFAVLAPAFAPIPAEASPEGLTAAMSAEEASPMPGPVGAKGTMTMDADGATGKVCYQLTYEGPGEMTGAHIHRGEKGITGPVTINLDVKAECIETAPTAVEALLEWPDGYYVEVHTLLYQVKNGAVRGQVAFSDGRPSVKPPNRID